MKPDFAIIRERVEGGFTTLLIDEGKATIRGSKLLTTGSIGRRKFENLLIITRPKERLKFRYQI